jgi:hypothetical protein
MFADSLHDLTDEENIKQAAFAFDRAERAGDAALAAWAREWGRHAVVALTGARDEVAAATDDADEIEREHRKESEALAEDVREHVASIREELASLERLVA